MIKKLSLALMLASCVITSAEPEEREFDDNSGSVFSSLTRVSKTKNSEIKKLDLSCDQDLMDISFLRFFPHLIELNLSNNHQLEDLTPLKYCTKLEKLNLHRIKVQDARFLLPLANLVSLKVTLDNPGTTIRVLKRLPKLEDLNLSGSAPWGIEKIGRLTNLKKLNLSLIFTDCYGDNPDCEFPTLAFLSSLVNLVDLDLCSNDYIKSLKPICKLPKLKCLNVVSNIGFQKDHLKVLTKLPKLKKLIVSKSFKNILLPESIRVLSK